MRVRRRAPAGTPPPAPRERRRRSAARRGRIAAALAMALPLTLLAGVNFTAQAADPACEVEYSANDWGAGFTASLILTNEGTAPIDGWTLTYSYAGNQRLSEGWNGVWSQSGQAVTVEDTGWNGTIAPGASV
ncbi:cellulose binding domain-containing protein, partial [Streptomyces sp. PT12]|uniref:cellulose binding domain-containing protein n=1 Tax=Streptomyces sp. PT12 TaxID=1510197 RepID=UPI000E047492